MKAIAHLMFSVALTAGAQTKATVQFILDPVEAAYPGNERVKPCGPANHDSGCVDHCQPHLPTQRELREMGGGKLHPSRRLLDAYRQGRIRGSDAKQRRAAKDLWTQQE